MKYGWITWNSRKSPIVNSSMKFLLSASDYIHWRSSIINAILLKSFRFSFLLSVLLKKKTMQYRLINNYERRLCKKC